MLTEFKTRTFGSIKRTKKECPENLSKAGRWAIMEVVPTQSVKLSKAAIWRKNNPDGIFTVVDWKAVNK